MSPNQPVLLLISTLLVLTTCLDANITTGVTNSTETDPAVKDQGLLEGGVNYLLGDNATKLIFDEDSPIQYAINFNYGPLITSTYTILDFITSTNSPPYVLATYDYSSLLERLSPRVVREFAATYTSGYLQSVVLLLSSFLSGFAIFQVINYGMRYMFTQMAVQEIPEERTGGRSLKHLQRTAEDVLTAGENLETIDFQNESFDPVRNWLNKIVLQSGEHYYDNSV